MDEPEKLASSRLSSLESTGIENLTVTHAPASAFGARRFLVVEVVSARELQGGAKCNPFVTLELDGKQHYTAAKANSSNPVWHETFKFELPAVPPSPHASGPPLAPLPAPLCLEVCVYSGSPPSAAPSSLLRIVRNTFLGHVRIPVTALGGPAGGQLAGQEVEPTWHPLGRRGYFSLPVRGGQVCLRLQYVHEDAAPAIGSDEEPSVGKVDVLGDRVRGGSWGRGGGEAARPPKQLAGGVAAPPSGDLVKRSAYLFVRVIAARGVVGQDALRSMGDMYVRLCVGTNAARTRAVARNPCPEWDSVFAFALPEHLAKPDADEDAGMLELAICGQGYVRDDVMGQAFIPLRGAVWREPAAPPVQGRWYNLEDRAGARRNATKGEVSLALWMGTQLDEAFVRAWPADGRNAAAARAHGGFVNIPRLWYLRVHVVQAKGLLLAPSRHLPEIFVRGHISGAQRASTQVDKRGGASPEWKEDLLFVVAEPFTATGLHLEVLDHLSPGQDEFLGHVVIPLTTVEQREGPGGPGVRASARWCPLDRGEQRRAVEGQLRVQLSLEGGYHVSAESVASMSCTRPTAQQLWPRALGQLELGIVGATGLVPLQTLGARSQAVDAFCVAKYGRRWAKTRTLVGESNPQWQEQFGWSVVEPGTVLMVCVFDNRRARSGGSTRDALMGKVRVRVSALESGRKHLVRQPLLLPLASGVRKMGELQLAVRLSCPSTVGLLKAYLRPPLPRLHYTHPLPPEERERLRSAAVALVSAQLAREDPALSPEVTEAMLDTEELQWSMRRSKANFNRIMVVVAGLQQLREGVLSICYWRHTPTTVGAHALYALLVLWPNLIVPTLFLYLTAVCLWGYPTWPRALPLMDAKLSGGDEGEDADGSSGDESDDAGVAGGRAEGISLPAPYKSYKLLKQRYERLKAVALRVQSILGAVASALERVKALSSWQDPRATAIFASLCFLAALIFYLVPFRVLALGIGFFIMRHPRLRNPAPPAPVNLFNRLPSLADRMI